MVGEVWLCVEAFGQTEAIKYLVALIRKGRKCSREGERVAERRKTKGKGSYCFMASCKAENVVCGKTFEEKYSFTLTFVYLLCLKNSSLMVIGLACSVHTHHPIPRDDGLESQAERR